MSATGDDDDARAIVQRYSLSDAAILDALREQSCADPEEHLQRFHAGEATVHMRLAILMAFHKHEQRPKH